jgi:hypothetical protein
MEARMKKGTKVTYVDFYGNRTDAKVVSVEPNGTYAVIKLLEAYWDLRNNLMLSRKGAVKTVAVSSLSV